MTEAESVDPEPAEVVRRFIAEMHDWEAEVFLDYKTSDPAELEAMWGRARSTLGAIFDRWCTPKERKQGRLGSFSHPPEYQPEHEAILETVVESPRRTVVITQQGTGFRHKRMYVLLKQAGRWRIDGVKWWQGGQGKWAAGIL